MRLLLGSLLLLALAPRAATLRLLVKMTPEQERFLRKEALPRFEAAEGCTVQVITFGDNWELEKKLAENGAVDVVKVPMGMARPLMAAKRIMPLENAGGREAAAALAGRCFLTKLGSFMGKLYYVPRKFDTRIMVYRRARVAEAAAGWAAFRPAIDSALRKSLGAPLDAGYRLDPDPNRWSDLDLFVAGFYWSRTPYDGVLRGRVGYRGKDYSGTAIGLMDRCFQMGARTQDIVNPASPHFNSVLYWESLSAHYGVIDERLWKTGWEGRDLWGALGGGEIFVTYLTQIDCYALHGAGGGQRFVENPDDIGYAVMPEGRPLESGQKGGRAVSTGGWLWGVAAGSPAPAAAFRLVEFLVSRDLQVAECGYFGMIPVLNELLAADSPGFAEPWKNEVYRVSVRQLRLNGDAFLPHLGDFSELERKYNRIWRRVVEKSRDGVVPRTAIAMFQQD